ncbi:hypothetical protein HSR122_0496 [Halapricum desulfuricans]|uniref:Uncharacterized protein n=1 Tax=Halapricum desulfuricans TaxID=2841257 RepID=A0A897N9U9_9EURY|nr:hypothetical protein HSR122_0496 [Halapricum desulfuricans]
MPEPGRDSGMERHICDRSGEMRCPAADHASNGGGTVTSRSNV